MKITSPAFEESAGIPTIYTCEGQDISPELNWTDVPEKAKSLALIVDDPDAPSPDAPKMVWIHWVLFNIPPDTKGLKEAIRDNELPKDTKIGINSWQKQSYGGPCPPIGRHRYYHKLFALDTTLEDLDNLTADELLAVMKDHIIDKATLIGTYIKVNKE
jgi:Raf kinase inhibitor-like YbhB/YbcL family protein